MDNIDCLKELTESIVKKQNDSLESLKKLSQATDIVSSDISNLINSLQMVGNRQFAENRVQEDEPLAQVGSLTTSPQVNKNAAPMSAHDPDGNELTLRTILLRAIRLLPPEEEEEQEEEEEATEEGEEAKATDDCFVKDNENKEESLKGHMDEEASDRSNDDKIIRVDGKEDCRVSQIHQQKPNHGMDRGSIDTGSDFVESKARNRPLNRDRVADILKKYSLYDDDEDDDEEDDDDG